MNDGEHRASPPIAPGPPHLEFLPRESPRWIAPAILGSVLIVPFIVAVALSVVATKSASSRSTYVPSPPEPIAVTATIHNAYDSRPVAFDVNGDGIDDLVSAYTTDDRTWVIAISGSDYKTNLAQTLPITGSEPLVLWHPDGAPRSVVEYEDSSLERTAFDLLTDETLDATELPPCREADGAPCSGRVANEFVELGSIMTPAQIRATRKDAIVDEHSHAWLSGDRFIVRAEPSKASGVQMVAGGVRSAHKIEWSNEVPTLGSAARSVANLPDAAIDRAWTVDESAGLFFVVYDTQRGAARVVARSVKSGDLLWESSTEYSGAIRAEHGRVYVSSSYETAVFDSRSGYPLARVRNTSVTAPDGTGAGP